MEKIYERFFFHFFASVFTFPTNKELWEMKCELLQLALYVMSLFGKNVCVFALCECICENHQ
jgi:hypothetical protein